MGKRSKMRGFYENFPVGVHRTENFTVTLSTKKLQQKLIQVLNEVNRRTFSFEEVANPSVPQCTIIFELGIADAESFSYINDEEAEKTLEALDREPFRVMDFFCAVRYYKVENKRKTPLKFDYFMIRFVFGKDAVELRVFHERGPRYISPEDITILLVNQINRTSTKKLLKPVESD
ncbi:MAG: hypothetical protein NWE94_07630 [Candidatus Bathyarchaeota archaeon]|nr:hypothetical protein [Candidatus Bathyarchaeota archaeon]